MSDLSLLDIEDTSVTTTDKRKKPVWNEKRCRKLTACNFGTAIKILINWNTTDIQQLPNRIYYPNSITYIPAIKWGIEHDPQASAVMCRQVPSSASQLVSGCSRMA